MYDCIDILTEIANGIRSYHTRRRLWAANGLCTAKKNPASVVTAGLVIDQVVYGYSPRAAL